MLKVNNISFSYLSSYIIEDLSLELEEGKIGTLIGMSGSGKTTLFKLLTGLLKPKSGSIEIKKNQISCMMQDDLLLPWRNVLENVILPLEISGNKRKTEEALSLLQEVGLEKYSRYYPEQLSGGMRQRVALARALIQKRPYLLLDEPFGALDLITREQMYKLLLNIREKWNTTILLITHDFRDALTLSDRIFLLCKGKIKEQWKVANHPEILGEMREAMLTG